jgi:hypothetical protein
MVDIDKAFYKAGTSFKRAIPGQSLTNSPDTPHPFEGPPIYTNRTKALEYFFELLTEEKVYERVLDALEDGTAVMDIVKVLVYKAFSEGLINPDMMLIVAEPLAYMIASLAERANVEFVISNDPDDDEDEEEPAPAQGMQMLNNSLSTIKNPQKDEEFPAALSEKLENVEPPRSLLGEK